MDNTTEQIFKIADKTYICRDKYYFEKGNEKARIMYKNDNNTSTRININILDKFYKDLKESKDNREFNKKLDKFVKKIKKERGI